MLTVRDHMALTIADSHFKYPGARVSAIRDLLSMTETRHAQLVNALIDRPDAMAERPASIRRLRSLRDARRRVRRSA